VRNRKRRSKSGTNESILGGGGGGAVSGRIGRAKQPLSVGADGRRASPIPVLGKGGGGGASDGLKCEGGKGGGRCGGGGGAGRVDPWLFSLLCWLKFSSLVDRLCDVKPVGAKLPPPKGASERCGRIVIKSARLLFI